MKKCILVAMVMAAGIAVLGGGSSSIEFDKTKGKKVFKEGTPATGTYTIHKDYTAIGTAQTAPLTGNDIATPIDGPTKKQKFKATTSGYSTTKDDAVIFLMLKNKKTGHEENESNALRDRCSIVGIKGSLTGSAYPRGVYDETDIIVNVTFMPPGLGGIKGTVDFTINSKPARAKTNVNSNILKYSGYFTTTWHFIGKFVFHDVTYAGISFRANGKYDSAGSAGSRYQ